VPGEHAAGIEEARKTVSILLADLLADGLDVDGCDVSADMIAFCREKAERQGLAPTLFVQAMHELEPPRSYRTIFVCGGFGLGSDSRLGLRTAIGCSMPVAVTG
jgi:SAM-dependent methyltransferase